MGVNGSGKTSIIECLKYATTGEQPPNTKGGAFVHDPKVSFTTSCAIATPITDLRQLCGEREVLAQVKLKFKSTNGTQMVATRNIQLSVKQQSRSMKTLECQLLMNKNGERISVSSRVAELDHMIPIYLGVSKAILQNVVFCHQDESLWPLSEPSVLKKKFDEIFEALKYTKAIDNLKIQRKKQAEELKVFETQETAEKANKNRADKVCPPSLEAHPFP